MSSVMTTRETNRLHRWAMWRMAVNEGIIACIRHNGTTRVIYPDSGSSSDDNSVGSEVGAAPGFREFPFITAEQMSAARQLNLRERYGSHHGLSDDAYFIFGLPRIAVGKDVPEVTSTGTRSVYDTFSELGDLNNNNYNNNNGSSNAYRGTAGGGGRGVNTSFNATYSELGPTPDELSLASQDVEVQKINGATEWRASSALPVPRLNLHSIQEELHSHPRYRVRQAAAQRYNEDRPVGGSFEPSRGPASPRYHEDRTVGGSVETSRGPVSPRHLEDRTLGGSFETSRGPVSPRYHEDRTVGGSFETSRGPVSPRYHEDRTVGGSVEISQGPSSPRYSLTSGPTYTYSGPEEVSRSPPAVSTGQFGGYPAVSPSPKRSESVYPLFSGRQSSQEPASRMSYSPPPSSPHHHHHNSSPPVSPRQSYLAFPDMARKSYSPLPSEDRQSYSPLPTSPRPGGFPSAGVGQQDAGRAGYGGKMRPTRLLSDGQAERAKRQAYYDWTTPTVERHFSELAFCTPSRFS